MLLLMPSMGTLFNFNPPQKPILETVEIVRNLELDEPLRLFATQPFQPSRSEVYFNDDYIPIKYKPANTPFDEYISEHKPNIIIITKDGWHLKDDESWLAFQQDPEILGYKKLPYNGGDEFGAWWIYQQE
ncbi:MAG: hypothetical protein GY755_23705 [Chloroflexi bacterium]|nr:hypothetical protein [Chloroflexota bacterium]